MRCGIGRILNEEGIPTRVIAEAIGRGLDVPVVSVPSAQARDHFGWIGRFIGADAPASNQLTRELMDWKPTHQGLIALFAANTYELEIVGACAACSDGRYVRRSCRAGDTDWSPRVDLQPAHR